MVWTYPVVCHNPGAQACSGLVSRTRCLLSFHPCSNNPWLSLRSAQRYPYLSQVIPTRRLIPTYFELCHKGISRDIPLHWLQESYPCISQSNFSIPISHRLCYPGISWYKSGFGRVSFFRCPVLHFICLYAQIAPKMYSNACMSRMHWQSASGPQLFFGHKFSRFLILKICLCIRIKYGRGGEPNNHHGLFFAWSRQDFS